MKLPVVVIACQVFQHLIEKYLPEEQRSEIRFLDYGLHQVPKHLRSEIQEQIDRIEAPSLIILAFGLCGNGLDKIQAGKHILVIPRTDDCIAIFLGSYAAYQEQFQSQPGTYYLTKGWLESGSNPLEEYKKLLPKYGQEKSQLIMDLQYQHYKRLLFVAHNQQDLEKYRPQAQEVAKFCEQWGIQYGELRGSEDYVKNLVEYSYLLANHNENDFSGDDFIIVPPGGELKQELFFRF